MTRTVAEWIGRRDDTPAPDRVKDRILQKQDGRCAVCAAPFSVKVRPEFDHRIAIINGGENREANLRALCGICHGTKTAADVAQKSKDARVRQKHMGLVKRPKSIIPGSKGSPWKRRIDGTTVRRDAE